MRQVIQMGEQRNASRLLVGKLERRKLSGNDTRSTRLCGHIHLVAPTLRLLEASALRLPGFCLLGNPSL
jgi:hypothetical protein